MKSIYTKTLAAALIALTAIVSSGNALGNEVNGEAIINLRQADPETLQKIMQGLLPNIILEISKNEQLPLHLFLKGDLIELNGDQSTLSLKINKDLYVKNQEGIFYFSTDFTQWRHLIHFIRGKASVSLNMSDTETPCITFGAEIYEQ